jgi:sucrose-6-phosphate hydrolase SacC (GH32 family)
MAFDACAAAPGEKTLVSWVTLDEGSYRGGSVLTIQRGPEFDAIVLGEIKRNTWMAGSDNFARTNQAQEYPAEEKGKDDLIQIAIVYADDSITIYRNGKELTSYNASPIDSLEDDDHVILFGVRHLGGGDGEIHGTIEDARIYAKALSANEIAALKPDEPSSIAPWAWFDFEDDQLADRTGRFTVTNVDGEARLNDGRLVLGTGAAVVAARSEDALKMAMVMGPDGEPLADPSEWVGETPAMPSDVPDHWVTYHIAHPGPGRAEPGDPNAAIYYKGRYHMHYIYRTRFGFCFAHLSSEDMVNWKWHETTLAPPTNGGYGMFSGTAFLTKQGTPAIVYHGEGRDRNVIQIAQDDTLDTWSEALPIIPMGPDGKEAESTNWDPDCWLRDGTYYAISGGRPPELMKSDDLKNWEFLGKLFHEDTDWEAFGLDPNEDVSCANMFKIGDKWMLLCISHDLGCRYFLGDFKDEKFLPTEHHAMNWRNIDFFAPESLLTPDGRRVMWAWMTDELWEDYTGRQSLPREISLPEDGIVRQKPLRELQSLRYDEQNEGIIDVATGERHRLEATEGPATEISAVFDPTGASAFGMYVFCGDEGKQMRIGYLADEKKLVVGEVKAPFELKEDEALRLTVYLDKGMVDVFANDRQAVTTGLADGHKRTGIDLFAMGDDIRATVKGWKMRSTYTH